jgi:hypothetical protein
MMSSPSVPPSAPVLKLLTPGNGVLHLYALCLSTAPNWCGVCGGSFREPALIGGIHCERCGTRFHDRCYLKVASIAEPSDP